MSLTVATTTTFTFSMPWRRDNFHCLSYDKLEFEFSIFTFEKEGEPSLQHVYERNIFIFKKFQNIQPGFFFFPFFLFKM